MAAFTELFSVLAADTGTSACPLPSPPGEVRAWPLFVEVAITNFTRAVETAWPPPGFEGTPRPLPVPLGDGIRARGFSLTGMTQSDECY